MAGIPRKIYHNRKKKKETTVGRRPLQRKTVRETRKYPQMDFTNACNFTINF